MLGSCPAGSLTPNVRNEEKDAEVGGGEDGQGEGGSRGLEVSPLLSVSENIDGDEADDVNVEVDATFQSVS